MKFYNNYTMDCFDYGAVIKILRTLRHVILFFVPALYKYLKILYFSSGSGLALNLKYILNELLFSGSILKLIQMEKPSQAIIYLKKTLSTLGLKNIDAGCKARLSRNRKYRGSGF